MRTAEEILAREALARHVGPYTLDYDWGWEVKDKFNQRVTLVSSEDEAKAVQEWMTREHEETVRFWEEYEASIESDTL